MPRTGRATTQRILIVDDDADYRAFLRQVLEEMDYEVVEAPDGRTALELLEAEAFQVVLLDLFMPGMDGAEVLARLPPSGPRVVLLTGAPIQDVSSALSRKPHYYLPKGAGPEALSLMLHSLGA